MWSRLLLSSVSGASVALVFSGAAVMAIQKRENKTAGQECIMASAIPGKVNRGTQGLSPERARSQACCHSPTIPPGALNLG